MTKLIVIIGVTGTQGRSVAQTFLKLPGWRVRGVTRSPSSEAAQALSAQGVEVVHGDLDDRDGLQAAFTGAAAIFVVTDFWAHFKNPASAEAASAAGRTVNEHAMELEIAQGMNAAAAAASPAVLATLERFVFSSLSEVRRWSRGKYTHVYHFDGKAEIANRIRAELPALAARMSTVLVGHYVTNWKLFAAMAPVRQADGSWLVLRPEAPGTTIPFVHTERDTGAFVKALVLDLPAGKQLLGESEATTWPKYMELWGRHLGVKAGFKQIPMDEFTKDVPDVLKEELAESHQFNAEFGWDGGDPEVLHVEDLPVEVPRTSVAEYVRSEDWSPLLRGR